MDRMCVSSVLWISLLYSFITAVHSVMCPPPASIPNGSYYPVKEEYHFADVVKYECDNRNMAMKYDSSVYCKENGIWSDPLPQCIEVNCEPPHVPHSRKLSGFVGPYLLNFAVRFECKEGFIMNGSDTIVCNIDSTWEPPPPDCKEVKCEPPHVPHSQKLSGFVGPYLLNSMVRFECKKGFIMNGPDTIVCNIDSTWEPPPPDCIAVMCPPPASIPNGSYYPVKGEYHFADAVKYECNNRNMVMKYNSSVYCKENGIWSDPLPQCIESFCPEPILSHGRVAQGKKVDGYIVSDSITLECDTKYKLNGASRVTCGSDFQWYPALPTCELGAFCPEPILVNGKILHGKKTHGYYEYDSITLACNSGYKLNGYKRLRCTRYYKWDNDFPICELVRGCSSPKIYNGRVTHKNGIQYDPQMHGHGFSSSDQIDITCDSGYRRRGSSRSTCEPYKPWNFFSNMYVWSPELPACERDS